MVIFDCNGVLVDSEPIASAVLADAFTRAGLALSAETVARRFHGRRPADIFAAVEKTMGKTLPPALASSVASETLRRFRSELRALPHVDHALTWIRGPKAVASSSPLDRIRFSLDVAGLLRFFGPRLFSASNVPKGKPAPDLFRLAATEMNVAPANCIVVEDSVAGVAAAVAAGMVAIGFVGGSQTPGRLATDLVVAAGARTAIADMRALKGAIADLRGW
jgi:HAD superfamily hydrolase (TIGR01509 family)